jgi:hypothetical protein
MKMYSCDLNCSGKRTKKNTKDEEKTFYTVETRLIPTNPAYAKTISRHKFSTFQPMVSGKHDLCQNNTHTYYFEQNGVS